MVDISAAIYEMPLYVSFPTLTTSHCFYICTVPLFHLTVLFFPHQFSSFALSYLEESVFLPLFVPTESHKNTQFLAFLLRPLANDCVGTLAKSLPFLRIA